LYLHQFGLFTGSNLTIFSPPKKYFLGGEKWTTMGAFVSYDENEVL
jgi:hypothetical protein